MLSPFPLYLSQLQATLKKYTDELQLLMKTKNTFDAKINDTNAKLLSPVFSIPSNYQLESASE